MKRFLTLVLTSLFIFQLNAQTEKLKTFLDHTDAFLAEIIDNGKVNYYSIKQDEIKLQALSQQIVGMNLQALNEAEQKAFLINAYNIYVIQGIIAEYPVNSPQNIPNFFDAKKYAIGDQIVSLNQLEKDLLKPKTDPRLHFVLVCGAKGCPIIEPFAYRPEKLDAQLDQQTTKAMDNRKFIRLIKVAEEVKVSEIFKWYKADFAASPNTLDYINQYRSNKIPDNYKVSFYDYDWSLNEDFSSLSISNNQDKSNLLAFTPSALFSKGQYEVNVFNSIYYQNALRDREGDLLRLSESQSFLNSMIQFTTGLSKSARFNVGIDVNVVSARYSRQEARGTDFFGSDGVTFRETIVSSIGPRIKLNPFKKIPRLSVQSTFLIPLAQDQETRSGDEPGVSYFIFHDRYTWFTQVFLDQSIGEQFQLFLEADLLYRINRNSTINTNFFRIPISAFFSYFPDQKSTLFVFSQYSPRFEEVSNSVESQFGLSQWFTQIGLGGKYQLTPQLGVELSYSDFVLSRNDGAGNNLNFGLRYIYR